MTEKNVRTEFRRLLAEVESLDEMKELQTIFNARWRAIQEEQGRAVVDELKLGFGVRVQFEARGRTVRGTVLKINRKTVQVKEDAPAGQVYGGMMWKVTPGLLRKDEGPAPPTPAKGPSDDEIDLVISKWGTTPEKIRTLHRSQFKAAEWRELLANSRRTALGQVGVTRHKINGGECHKKIGDVDMGGCGAHEVVTIYSSRRGPECVLFRNRCLACGREDEDVAD